MGREETAEFPGASLGQLSAVPDLSVHITVSRSTSQDHLSCVKIQKRAERILENNGDH